MNRSLSWPILCVALVVAQTGIAAAPSVTPTFLEANTGFGAIHGISGSGHRVVFESGSDLTGGNADGNSELFRWSDDGSLIQLTSTSGSNYFWEVDVNFEGNVVMVIADADLMGEGATRTEIYRWTEGGGWTRLTQTTGAIDDVFIGGIGISADGHRLMFTSRGDYVGANPTGEEQVFLWDVTGGFAQITNGTPCGSGGGNFGIDLSGAGNRVLFSSRCQYGSWNTDLNMDLFMWDQTSGIFPLSNETQAVGGRGTINFNGNIVAVTSSTDLVNGGWGTANHLFRWVNGVGFSQLSSEGVADQKAAVSDNGQRIVYCALNGQGNGGNPEAAPELFLWEEGYGLIELTDSAQSDTTYGNERADLNAAGDRVSMTALRAFDSPTDNRTGYFVLDLWLFYDDFELGTMGHWTVVN